MQPRSMASCTVEPQWSVTGSREGPKFDLDIMTIRVARMSIAITEVKDRFALSEVRSPRRRDGRGMSCGVFSSKSSLRVISDRRDSSSLSPELLDLDMLLVRIRCYRDGVKSVRKIWMAESESLERGGRPKGGLVEKPKEQVITRLGSLLPKSTALAQNRKWGEYSARR